MINRQLDLLVEMAEHCKNRKQISRELSKCFNCNIHFNFNLGSHGCFLVETLENDDFMNILIDTCKYRGIEYKEKIDKIMEIFNEEYED